MNKTTSNNGKSLAKNLYSKQEANAYQVRDKQGHKLAEYDNPEETSNYLRGRNHNRLEVWVLEGVPGELIDICDAGEFIEK